MAAVKELKEAWDTNIKEREEWVNTRPKIIQDMIASHPPYNLYLMKSSPNKLKVTIYSYSEDNTVTVIVSGQYNFVAFERHVFGVSLDDLIECDLPQPGDLLGCAFNDLGFTQEEQTKFLLDAFKEAKQTGEAPHDIMMRNAEAAFKQRFELRKGDKNGT